MSTTALAASLNKQAGTFFSNREYAQALPLYWAAIEVDQANTPAIYFSNLAATYLKLEYYQGAKEAADTALKRDPTLVKARYRRAMGHKGAGRLPECLLDLYCILTTNPTNPEARSAFINTLSLYDRPGKATLNPGVVLKCDYPPAHSSISILSSTTHASGPAPASQLPRPTRSPRPGAPHIEITLICSSCGSARRRKDVKYCSQCNTVAYCNTACQRADWYEFRILDSHSDRIAPGRSTDTSASPLECINCCCVCPTGSSGMCICESSSAIMRCSPRASSPTFPLLVPPCSFCT
ncbi:hypothetical protein DFH09DRAFT_1136254 [Mycena vulgaris]|nr:hypothetical protein DFH09DRAFT_1136254 [Mycena vulgaris]